MTAVEKLIETITHIAVALNTFILYLLANAFMILTTVLSLWKIYNRAFKFDFLLRMAISRFDSLGFVQIMLELCFHMET